MSVDAPNNVYYIIYYVNVFFVLRFLVATVYYIYIYAYVGKYDLMCNHYWDTRLPSVLLCIYNIIYNGIYMYSSTA